MHAPASKTNQSLGAGGYHPGKDLRSRLENGKAEAYG
jgi:hypothetical protein